MQRLHSEINKNYYLRLDQPQIHGWLQQLQLIECQKSQPLQATGS